MNLSAVASGVLVVEELYYVYQTRRNETAIVLWKNENAIFTHPNGNMNEVDNHDLKKTAERVLIEKSSGLIYFLNSELLNTLVKLGSEKTYVIGIKSGILFRRDFLNNRARFQNFAAVHCSWKKSVDMDRFYISDLTKVIEKREIDSFDEKNDCCFFTNCVSANGEMCKIENRTLDIIKSALNDGLITLVTQFPFNYVRMIHESAGFKCGLVSLIPYKNSNVSKPKYLSKNHFNIEIKARVPIEKFENIQSTVIKESSVIHPNNLYQHDRFYQCDSKENGKLKLRRENGKSELISYQRNIDKGPKKSDVSRCLIQDPESLNTVLSHALGIIGEVKKVRQLYWIENTRVHIDSVENLDNFFIEFEVTKCDSIEEGQKIAKNLLLKLGIEEDWLIEESYLDLILKRCQS